MDNEKNFKRDSWCNLCKGYTPNDENDECAYHFPKTYHNYLIGQPMRLKNLYQIHDIKAESVSGPIFAEYRDAVAIRAFNDAIERSQDQNLGIHPEDFELRLVGVQDEITGQLQAPTPVTVATGKQWKASQQEREKNA